MNLTMTDIVWAGAAYILSYAGWLRWAGIPVKKDVVVPLLGLALVYVLVAIFNWALAQLRMGT